MTDLTTLALRVAETYSVFPTTGKTPAWSNKELGVERGKGGYHTATKAKTVIKDQFIRGTCIGVPCRPNGIVVVDVDLYKDGADKWHGANYDVLRETLCHNTPGGGYHYIFQDPGGRLPGTLAPGVDLKVNGYINWAGAGGYEVYTNKDIQPFPQELLQKTNGADKSRVSGAGDAVSDDVLVDRILDASELYPALRTLSYRLAKRRIPAKGITDLLNKIMGDSAAASPDHPRHDDWAQRYEKIGELASSAVEKSGTVFGLQDIETLKGVGFFDQPEMFTAKQPKTESAFKQPASSGIWNINQHHEDLKDRMWALQNIVPTGQLTVLSAAGGTGKSMLSLMMAMSLITRTDITGNEVPQKTNVWVINNEDDRAELDRRLVGLRDAFDVPRTDAGELHLIGAPAEADAEFFELAHKPDGGEVTIKRAAFDYVEDYIVEHDIKLLVLDPFISLIRGAATNDNDAVYAVSAELRKLAQRTGCAVLVVHHNRKGTTDRNSAENMMGAASLGNAARSVLIAASMDSKTAKIVGVPKSMEETAALRCFSLIAAKQNLSERTPPVWFYMESFELGNGDSIGVPRRIGDLKDLQRHFRGKIGTSLGLAAVVDRLIEKVGPGIYSMLAKVFITPFKDDEDWPYTERNGRSYDDIKEAFKDPVPGTSGGSVQVETQGRKTTITVKNGEEDD